MSMKWLTEFSSPISTNNSKHSRRRSRVNKTVFATLALSVALSGCSLLPSEPVEEDLSAIELPKISEKPKYDVTTKTLETKVSGSGKMMSTNEKTLYFSMDKRLKKLYVRTGDQVVEGQIIAELDVDDKVKQLRNQELSFKKTEAAMKVTLRNRDEMDPAEFEQAMIDFEIAQQALVDLREEIDKAVLYAPYSGTIVSISTQEGAEVKAYASICVIADPTSLVVAATLSKEDLKKIALGMEVQVDINNAGKVTGTVLQLPQPTTTDQNGSGKTESLEQYLLVDVPKLPETATRGTPLSVSVVVNRKENVVVIPISALRTIGARTYVQVSEADGTKREVDVEVGQQTSTDIEIVQGLTPGQKVVGR
ncbi:MAG: efflux RND transporter periplasmic adaptor subunit [Candidatus Cohnella colombiensis]|uniref:Efflux RND transporter periplasmic adaptor subunit n=1 Tax=Candidatus Cohnella colombiensis TaxID=3121368 RepID=A0AA95ETG7_9BACL|nr:MAG: efflux RND transporter periplasmic adaptor subunit [Cohnella sp.]